MARHFIFIGSPTSPGLPNLPHVEIDLQHLSTYLQSSAQLYEWVLKDISIGATAHEVREALGMWFGSDERKTDDDVIIHIAGHGEYQIGSFLTHKLALADSRPNLPYTYLALNEIAELIFNGKNERPKNVLLIVDVCYAGRSAGTAMTHYQMHVNSDLEGGAGFNILASTGSESEAEDGCFVNALLDVLSDDDWQGGRKYIPIATIIKGVNDWFELNGKQQRCVYSLAGAMTDGRFFMSKKIDLTHWDVKARGIDHSGDNNWFFCGRQEVLHKLVAWLVTPSSDGLILFVIGNPGSGKSAIMGRLYLSSLQSTRAGLVESLGLEDTDPALAVIGSIQIAINARGLGLQALIRTMSRLIKHEVENAYDLADILKSINKTIGILIDGLDEALEPKRIENELLPMLGSCPWIRLIVATRKTSAVHTMPCVVLDIDDPHYFSEQQLADYVHLRLNAAIQADNISSTLKQVATAIAQKAQHSYLYARVVASSFARQAVLKEIDVERWPFKLELPENINQAFEQDLNRFPSLEKQKVIDLLLPLAYSKGKGLPVKNVWRTISSIICGKEYSNDDIRTLKEIASYYLVTDTEGDDRVYRLFHQAFADFLKVKTIDEDVEKGFVTALLYLRERQGGIGKWQLTTEPYLLKFFAAHAADANLLEQQLLDLDFLLHYPVEYVLPYLFKIRSSTGKNLLKTYRRVSSFAQRDKKTFLAQLVLKASQYNAHDLLNILQHEELHADWIPVWSAWAQRISNYTITESNAAIQAYILYEDEVYGQIAVCIYTDYTLKIWELRYGKLIETINLASYALKTTYSHERMNRMDVVRHMGHLTLVVAGNQGTLLILRQGSIAPITEYNGRAECRGLFLRSEGAALYLFVVVERDERTNISVDTWSLPQMTMVRRIDHAFQSSVYTFAVASYQGQDVVIATGDTLIRGNRKEKASPLKILSIPDFKLIWELNSDVVGIIEEAKWITWQQKLWLFAVSRGEKIFIVNPETNRHFKISRARGADYLVGFRLNNDHIELLGSTYNVLQRFKLSSTTKHIIEAADLTEGPELSIGNSFQQINLHERTCLVEASHEKLRIWDFEELFDYEVTAGDNILDFNNNDRLIGGLVLKGLFISYTAFGKIYRWEHNGKKLTPFQFPCGIKKVASYEIDSCQLLMIAGIDNWLYIFDPIKVEIVEKFELEKIRSVTDLQIVEINGNHRIVMSVNNHTSDMGGYYTVRTWDLQSKTEVILANGRVEYRMMGYYVEKGLDFVHVAQYNDMEYYIFGAPNGEIQVQDREGIQVDCWVVNSQYRVRGHACTAFSDSWLLYAAVGYSNGMLSIRNILGPEQPDRNSVNAHKESINIVTTYMHNDSVILITGADDGAINFWSVTLKKLYTIEIESAIIDLSIRQSKLYVVCQAGVVILDIQWHVIVVANS